MTSEMSIYIYLRAEIEHQLVYLKAVQCIAGLLALLYATQSPLLPHSNAKPPAVRYHAELHRQQQRAVGRRAFPIQYLQPRTILGTKFRGFRPRGIVWKPPPRGLDPCVMSKRL
jgi:hypothetical protein